MIPNPYPGKFIVFEGIDGAGKTTMARMLQKYYTYPVGEDSIKQPLLAKEPDKGNVWGRRIYEELNKEDGLHVRDRKKFQMWYACASKISMEQNVVPALENGTMVISDRYRSSCVYGAEKFSEVEGLLDMNLKILGLDFIWPDAIVIIDAPVEIALARLQKKGTELDGHERKTTLERVRGHYISFAHTYPNCFLIDGSGDSMEVFKEVVQKIYHLLN